MSTERTNITIQVSTKWEADVIQKWIQLKKGPEAVAEAIGKVGDKTKAAGGAMDAATKGWQGDFKNIIRGLTGVGVAFKALDGIIAALRYGITTWAEQTVTAQHNAAQRMAATGAALTKMFMTGGVDRIQQQMGMSPDQFTGFLKTKNFGGLAPEELYTGLQDVFSQMRDVPMRQIIEAFSDVMQLQPSSTGADAAALVMSVNPLITRGGAYEGKFKEAFASLLVQLQESVIKDPTQFAKTSSAYSTYIQSMGTPEGIAERQAELDRRHGVGVVDAKIDSFNRGMSILIRAQNLATDLEGRQTANAALAAAQGMPSIYRELALDSSTSPEDRAHAMQVLSQGFGAFFEEVENGSSRLSQAMRYIIGGVDALNAMEINEAGGGLTPRQLEVLERMRSVDAAVGLGEEMEKYAQASPTLRKYWQEGEVRYQQLQNVLATTAAFSKLPASPEAGERKGRIPVQSGWFVKGVTDNLMSKLPRNAAEAAAAYKKIEDVRNTPAAMAEELIGTGKRVRGEYEADQLTDAVTNELAEMEKFYGTASRKWTAPLRSFITRMRGNWTDNTMGDLRGMLVAAKTGLVKEANLEASGGVPAYEDRAPLEKIGLGMRDRLFGRHVVDPPRQVTQRASDLSASKRAYAEGGLGTLIQRIDAYMAAQAESAKKMVAETEKQTELLRQNNQPKEMTLQGTTGIRVPAQSKVPASSPNLVTPHVPDGSDLELTP